LAIGFPALILSGDRLIATLSQSELPVVAIESEFSNLLNCPRGR
jgi:hypothetical protein